MKKEIRGALQETIECALAAMHEALDGQDIPVYRLEILRQYIPLLKELALASSITNNIEF